MRKILKTRLKRLNAFLLSVIFLLQPITAYAGNDGYTEPRIDNVNDHVYFSDSTGDDLVFDYVGSDGKTYKTIVWLVPRFKDGSSSDVFENPNADYYNEIESKVYNLKNNLNNEQFDVETTYQEILDLLLEHEDWEDLREYINQLPSAAEQAERGWETGMTAEQAADMNNSNYKNTVPLIYKGNDSLICWKKDNRDYNYFGTESPQHIGGYTMKSTKIPGTGIELRKIYVNPITTDESVSYAAAADLKPGDKLDADAVIISDSDHLFLYYPDKNPFHDNKYKMSKAQSEDIDETTYHYYITPVSHLNGSQLNVIQWEVTNIYKDTEEFIDKSICVYNDEYSSYTYLAWKNWPKYTSDFADDTTWIELKPIYNQKVFPTPNLKVLNETYIQMSENTPYNPLGPIYDYESIDLIFCATNNLSTEYIYDNNSGNGHFVDESPTFDFNNDKKYYHEPELIQPGTYRIFKQQRFNNYCSSGEDILSDIIDHSDVTIEMPILEAPDIVQTKNDVTYNVKYPTMPSTGTEVYKDYIEIRRFITTDKNFELADDITELSEDLSINLDTKDTLTEGYNKIYTQLVLNLPEDAFGNDAKSYYSPIKEKVIYNIDLETPVINENDDTISITNNGPNALQYQAETKYVYCNYADDIFKDLSLDELIDYTSTYTNHFNKLDGISNVYAYSVAKNTIDGEDYTFYSDIAKNISKKAYKIEKVSADSSRNTSEISLSSGGYSSPLTSIDKSSIYYLITEEEPTAVELQSLVNNSNKYTAPFERPAGEFYLTTIENVVSDTNDGINLISVGQLDTTHFSEQTVTVSYDGNGGNASIDKEIKAYKEPYGNLATANRTGYSFEGWKYNKKIIESDDIVNTLEDHTLVAQWTPNSYTIKYNNTDGNSINSDKIYKYDVIDKLSKNSFKYPSKTITLKDDEDTTIINTSGKFLGWSDSVSGNDIKFTDEQEVMNLTTINNNTVNLYAVWKTNPIILPALQKEGYVFEGWCDADNRYAANEPIIFDKKDVVLSAEWRRSQYRIEFNANGGIGNMNNITSEYNKEVVLPTNNYQKEGYHFIGWSTNSEAVLTIQYPNKAHIKFVTGNDGNIITLYAIWEKDEINSTNKDPDNSNANLGSNNNSSNKDLNNNINEIAVLKTSPITRDISQIKAAMLLFIIGIDLLVYEYYRCSRKKDD